MSEVGSRRSEDSEKTLKAWPYGRLEVGGAAKEFRISECGLRKNRGQREDVGGWRSGPAGLEVGGKGKIIANLSFGLPPFGRVPSFGFRIANLGTRRQKKLKAERGKGKSLKALIRELEN